MSTLRQMMTMLRRAPGLTAVVVATLAFGIGATTLMFSIGNALFLRPLPHIDQARLVLLRGFDRDGAANWSYPNLADANEAGTGLDIAAVADVVVSMRVGADAAMTLAPMVTPNYFRALGVTAARGHFFTEVDGVAGTANVVISYEAWQRYFDGRADIVGSGFLINGRPVTVIGVAPAGFSGTFRGFGFDVWIPMGLAAHVAPAVDLADRRQGWLQAVARLPDGMSMGRASAALDVIARRLNDVSPEENREFRVEAAAVTGFDEGVRRGALGISALLLALASMVLIIASANVGGMLLARGFDRRKELVVRRALGASRRRLLTMLISEAAFLTVLGGIGGVLIAAWGVDLIQLIRLPAPVRLDLGATMDVRVLGFALTMMGVTALVTGLLPALRLLRPDFETLRQRNAPAEGKLWRGFVVLQIAVSLLLLTVSGFFVRSLQRAARADLGFETAGVVVRPRTDLSVAGLDAAQSAQAYAQLIERVESMPGVERAALTRTTPLGIGGGSMTISVEGDGGALEELEAPFTTVTPGYFEVMSTPILQGRGFTSRDGPDAPPVAIVSSGMAERLWPGQNAVGKTIVRNGVRIEVVGVARDVLFERRTPTTASYLYLPYAQRPARQADILVRGRSEEVAAHALAAALREVLPDVPNSDVMPLENLIATSVLPQRIAATVGATLGLLGGFLAALGMYGLMAWSVVRRRREIGIRYALGAPPAFIVRTVLAQGLALAALGLAIGLGLAIAAAVGLRALLGDIVAPEPIAFLATVMISFIIALGASVIPSLRAVRIPPAVAMTSD